MTRKFAIRLILFGTLILLINFIFDRLYKELAYFTYLNNTVDKQFSEYDDTLQYLTLGNSHNCINTYILDKTFNYGSPSENYAQTYYKLRSVLKKYNKIPENIILFIDMSDFGSSISNRFDYNAYWVKYVDYAEVARIKHNRDLLVNGLSGKYCSYAGNYKEMQLTLLYLIKIGHLDIYRGYHPPRDFQNFALLNDRTKYAKRKTGLYYVRGQYLDKDMAMYFERILKLCQDYKINVILIRIPVTREYFAEASKLIPVEKLYGEVSQIIKNYPNVTRVLDYHDLYFDRPDYFFDPDHLNPKGSDSLSSVLKRELKGMNPGD
jgi:hypothetical protein